MSTLRSISKLGSSKALHAGVPKAIYLTLIEDDAYIGVGGLQHAFRYVIRGYTAYFSLDVGGHTESETTWLVS